MKAALTATPEIGTALAKTAALRKNTSIEDWRIRANELKRYSFHRPKPRSLHAALGFLDVARV